MDSRFEKIASARKKLRDHQEKRKCPGNDNHTEIPHYENVSVLVTSPDFTPKIEAKETNNEVHNLNQNQNNQNNNGESIKNSAQTTTEILIANKRDLETQISVMEINISKIKNDCDQALSENHSLKKHVVGLQNELSEMHEHVNNYIQQLNQKEVEIKNISVMNLNLVEENKSLIEQLDFAKTAITTKENENQSLHYQIQQIQRQLEATELHLNQLTNGNGNVVQTNNNASEMHQIEELTQKIAYLEQKIKNMQKEHGQITSHYEHYVTDLNTQNKLLLSKNQELSREIEEHSTRESGLIEQISSMEIRIQQLQLRKDQLDITSHSTSTPDLKVNDEEITELKDKYNCIQLELEDMKSKVEALQSKLLNTIKEKEVLEQKLNSEHEDRTRNVSKLQDDMTNDKVAAQLATEQNRKLKKDIQELEEAFVKMSKDKLKLTEMLDAEKHLTRELTLKLADVDENAKDMSIKLNAKDNEMLRLQNSCRELEKQYNNLFNKLNDQHDQNEISTNQEVETNNTKDINDSETDLPSIEKIVPTDNINALRKEDAMSQLQERFMKIMNEVADLSDEKHRLEHIILQLQNETDTVCEYIALYQQQRSILKHREEERLAQLKLYRSECDKMRANLDELTKIVSQLPDNKITDSSKVVELIKSMKDNCLVNPERQGELQNFHPCACCSGVLLDV